MALWLYPANLQQLQVTRACRGPHEAGRSPSCSSGYIYWCHLRQRNTGARISEGGAGAAQCSGRAHICQRRRLRGLQATQSSSHVSAASGADAEQQSKSWERTAVLKASKRVTRRIEEAGRPLREYMALPASQYSVLDAKRIDRIDDSTFRCYVDSLHFFGLVVEPVLTVAVSVGDKGPTVKLLGTRLEGSSAVQSANDHFDATMTNIVQWTASENGQKHISSDTSIQVSLEVPGWMRLLPKAALEKVGSGAMQGVLNTMVPRFLKQLEQDYQRWAAGDESRTPVGTGQM